MQGGTPSCTELLPFDGTEIIIEDLRNLRYCQIGTDLKGVSNTTKEQNNYFWYINHI